MLVLFETPAGFAVFKLMNEKKLQESDNLYKDFETLDAAKKVVKLKMFDKFEDTTEALAAATASVEGKMSKGLKKLLKKVVAKDAQEKLAVADAKLGQAIQGKLDLQCVHDSKISELMRCIRSQADGLVSGIQDKEMTAMSLGLAHSLSRYKLKFSPDKIDTMIVQAVSLLDDLDKELNNYVMRCREWYGWHFPELGKIVTDNVAYVRTVLKMGFREKASKTDLSDVLPEDVEEKVKEAAEISMGTEISDMDLKNIQHLGQQIVDIQEYRAQLYEYLKNRMVAIAPNLTILVGELVGARLISHAGSLLNLAKHPASTVQILGSEKALFKALKTNHDTPKYGLIYHAQLVGGASSNLKGKVSRMVAAKAALGTRVDALGESATASAELGVEHRAKLEARIKSLEGGHMHAVSGSGKKSAKFDKYENKSEIMQYKPAADSSIPSKRKKLDEDDEEEEAVTPKKVKVAAEEEETEAPSSEKKKKKKKKKAAAEDEEEDEEEASPAKKAKTEENGGSEKKKKKKKKKAKMENGGANGDASE